jgi:OOP family OmpA-OmpF porin
MLKKRSLARNRPILDMPNWLTPIHLLSTIAAIVMGLQACTQDPREQTIVVESDSLGSQFFNAETESAGEGSIVNAGKMYRRKLPDGVAIEIPIQGIESKLLAFLSNDLQSVERSTVFLFDRISFTPGGATLDEAGLQRTANIAKILRAYPNVKLKIEGFTDNSGDPVKNLGLSQRRARAILSALVDNGVPENRLSAEGFGKENPVSPNDTEQGRLRNRRIELRVVEK